MKKFILTICSITFVIMTLTGCSNTKSSVTYVPYDQIPADYSLEDAKKDKCVIFEESGLTSGEEEWDEFVEKSDSGKKAFIRIASYSTALNVSDLSYDGKNYSYYSKEDGEEYKGAYPYLMHYTGELPSGSESKEYEYYILTHDDSLSIEEIQDSWLSSSTKDQLDTIIIYQTFE